MVNHEHYSYRVIWSVEDQEFVGLCAEFPSLSYLDENRSAALEGITNLVKDVAIDLHSEGEKIPEPISEKIYSRKLQISITPELHRMLALRAAEKNVSLNRYISYKLAN
ncbi:MAG: type II toxin-antitoxin system HicB family antitoxin [Xenococcaceae cyanobacterium]